MLMRPCEQHVRSTRQVYRSLSAMHFQGLSSVPASSAITVRAWHSRTCEKRHAQPPQCTTCATSSLPCSKCHAHQPNQAKIALQFITATTVATLTQGAAFTASSIHIQRCFEAQVACCIVFKGYNVQAGLVNWRQGYKGRYIGSPHAQSMQPGP